MKQVWISAVGAPETLVVREAPDPEVPAGSVRIRVRASGINFADVLARQGLYPDAPKLPAVVGYEVSGVIDRVGNGVTGFQVGQKVVALTRFGGYSDTVIAAESQIFPLPEGWTFEEGAALPVNYITAYQMLFAMGAVLPGERVLIHSAGGGVGFAALDFCRIAGAEALGVASVGKHAAIREAGAKHTFDARAPGLKQAVLDATKGQGVEIALDPNAGSSWKESLDCLTPTGRLFVYGFAGAARGNFLSRKIATMKTIAQTPLLALHPLSLINRNVGVLGVNLGKLWRRPDLIRKWMTQILTWAGEGKLRPRIDKAFPMAEAPAAHRRIEERQNIGKVVLTCSPASA